MSGPDRRRWPCNGRVAHRRLEGRAEAERFVDPVTRSVAVAVADLLSAPDGRRERQVTYGDRIDVLETRDGMAFVEAQKDGYVGYLPEDALAEAPAPTHRVVAPSTHLYPSPDIKQRETGWLTFGSMLCVTEEEGRFAATAAGFVPRRHLAPVETTETDPVGIAALFLGTPYLWGGNSRMGIDCSGLVQAACRACGIPCPGDSDMQERELGDPLEPDARLRRGDLIFWKGHVALVADQSRILHANAHAMAVAYEDREAAIRRIAEAGDGQVSSLRRLPGFG